MLLLAYELIMISCISTIWSTSAVHAAGTESDRGHCPEEHRMKWNTFATVCVLRRTKKLIQDRAARFAFAERRTVSFK